MQERTSEIEAVFLDDEVTTDASLIAESFRHDRSSGDKGVRLGTLEPPMLALLKNSLAPLSVLLSLAISMALNNESFTIGYLALGFAAYLVSTQLLTPVSFTSEKLSLARAIRCGCRLMLEWGAVLILLGFFAFALRVRDRFSPSVLGTWAWLAPAMLFAARSFGAVAIRRIVGFAARRRSYVVIGANDLGMEFASRLGRNPLRGRCHGFFDHRRPERLNEHGREKLVGHCDSVADYVRQNRIDDVFIALSMTMAPRIASLLSRLKDTTASIYFVPNVLEFDLLQARVVELEGIPAVSVCDTPHEGIDELQKRCFDFALSILALAALGPLMLAIAIGVRLSSPGPVFFIQRRYGLNGQEIRVIKFRTMSVVDDGAHVAQATKGDKRVTRFGALLRRTSLDELPQIFNVLEGTMSWVGPRPHAVAHNEQYRKLISGYMTRHKVRPGITGWAQVNGLRGETVSIEKMRQRVMYDIDYLRRWSFWLDVRIISLTIKRVFKDANAY